MRSGVLTCDLRVVVKLLHYTIHISDVMPSFKLHTCLTICLIGSKMDIIAKITYSILA